MPYRTLRRGSATRRPSRLITSTNPKCFLRLTIYITSTRHSSRYLSSVVREIWEKRCDASARAHAMIRTKGEPGTGDVVQAVRHMRKMNAADPSDHFYAHMTNCFEEAKQLQVPYELVLYVHENGKLPVVNFRCRRRRNSGGCGADDAARRRGCICRLRHIQVRRSCQSARQRSSRLLRIIQDSKLIASLSEDLGEAMVGINAE